MTYLLIALVHNGGQVLTYNINTIIGYYLAIEHFFRGLIRTRGGLGEFETVMLYCFYKITELLRANLKTP